MQEIETFAGNQVSISRIPELLVSTHDQRERIGGPQGDQRHGTRIGIVGHA